MSNTLSKFLENILPKVSGFSFLVSRKTEIISNYVGRRISTTDVSIVLPLTPQGYADVHKAAHEAAKNASFSSFEITIKVDRAFLYEIAPIEFSMRSYNEPVNAELRFRANDVRVTDIKVYPE